MKALLASLLLAFSLPAMAQGSDFLVIAHRGASGERPEHTLAAYDRAIDQGADYIEPDLVVTKDGVLVARHENEISGTTDVAERAEFASRRTTKLIDGEEVSGWFTEDFTLAELRSLRARERLPQLRVGNTAFDGLFQVPTLAEVIALVKAREAETGRRIGLYPEIKHPTYFLGLGHDLAAMLVAELHAAGYRSATDPVFIQSFEVTPLHRLAAMTDLRLVQLVSAQGGPADLSGTTYTDMLSHEGLARIAAYADAIGAELRLLVDERGAATGLIAAAHAARLLVHGWTLRKENAFLPPLFRLGNQPGGLGHFSRFLCLLTASGMDGVFTDDPGPVVRMRGAGDPACRTGRGEQESPDPNAPVR